MGGYGRIKFSSASLPALTGGGTWVANLTDSGFDVLTQNLGSYSFNAGDTLSVTFYLERDPYGSGGGELQASFLIDASPYSHTFDTTTQTVNTWQSYTLTKTIPAGVTGNLSLKFSNVSGRVGWLDNIGDVTVTPAPPPSGEPTSTNATLTAAEDTATALTAENFGYADPNSPPSPLAAVKITSLPAKGTLKNGGVTVGSGDLPLEVAVGNIGNLTYQSALNGNGAAYTTIGIKVKSENNLWSLAEADMTVNVTPVNDPPTSTGGSVSMKANTVKTFAASNFQFSDVDTGDTLHSIMVTSLPASGTLKLDGTTITSAPSAAIPVANIGTLTYTPNTDYSGSDPFNFQVSDGTTFSGDATMAITITVNQVPTSTGGSVIMRTNILKYFAVSDFQFSDVDSGDTLSEIKVTSLPTHGELLLNGEAIVLGAYHENDVIPRSEIGLLSYLPDADYVGPDSFNFQVSDGTDYSVANATMTISVTTDFLVLNGGFEDPTPHNPNNGTTADWTAGGWAFVGAPWTASTGNYGRLSQGPVASPQLGNWIFNLNGSGAWIKQNLGEPVNAGDTLSVTFQVMSDTLPGKVAASFLVATTEGTTEYSATFNNPQNNGVWVPYTLTQTIAVSGNLSVKFSNVGDTGVSDRLWLDNVSNVSVTPGGGSHSTTMALSRTTGDGSQTYGSPLAYTATVTGASSSPSGNVEFRDGANLLASVALTAGTAPESTAVYTSYTDFKVAGSPHSIVAYYLGDGTNDPSDSSGSPVAQTITPKALDYTGITAANKPYDGNQTASLSGSASVLAAEDPGTGSTTDGAPYTGDTVSFSTGTLTGTFAGAGPANGLAVTLTGGVTLTGADNGNYSVGSPAPALAANITPSYASWAGGHAFNSLNSEGVAYGMAWILGASTNATSSIGLLPKATNNSGKLVLTFDCLSAAARGAAVLKMQYSKDLGQADLWTNHEAVVPGAVGTSDVGNVHFVATQPGSLIHIVATIPASEASTAGKLFGRLYGVGD